MPAPCSRPRPPLGCAKAEPRLTGPAPGETQAILRPMSQAVTRWAWGLALAGMWAGPRTLITRLFGKIHLTVLLLGETH